MDHTTAVALVSKIEATWNDNGKTWSASRIDTWLEALERIHDGVAGTAFARLRTSTKDCPNVALFIQTCKAIDTREGGGNEPKCGWCDATGWTETARHQAHGQPYTGWEPCAHCDEGHDRATSEAWTKSPVRHFITDTEAERLTHTERQRHASHKHTEPPL